MTKELRELLNQIEQFKTEVRSLLGEDKVDEAEKKMAEVRALQRKAEVQKALEADEAGGVGVPLGGPKSEERDTKELEAEYRSIFLKGLRRKRISSEERSIISEYEKRVLHEGGVTADPDGDAGIIVPSDVQTRINEVMRTLNDLSKYVRIEIVNTLSGSRVLEKDEDMVPFAVVEEYGEIQPTDAPKFVQVAYKLVKRAGFLPITNELLRDSDQNIIAYVSDWIGRKHVVTRNSLITALLATLTKKDIASVKALKKVINVDVDPAIARTGIILTNQDGYNWLDEQEDQQGRPLLQPDITQPGRMLFKGLPIEVVANRYMPSEGTTTVKAPIIVGNLKQLAVLFSLGRYELASTKEGGDAWRRDTTEMRTIVRDDLQKWDAQAVVHGQLTVSTGA